MSWWKRIRGGIKTPTKEKKEAPDGLWYKCKRCKNAVSTKEHEENLSVCKKCNYHARIGSDSYFNILFESGVIEYLASELRPKDMLGFEDLKPYKKRIKEAEEKTGLHDAIKVAVGKIGSHRVVVAAMDFAYIGGSMGSVVGESIAMAIDRALEKKIPFIMISKSGGARMMESAFSLMQMAKTSSLLAKLSEKKIPYISILTDPTTGGVTASFAMLGDINIAEPEALIAFAGPRVIKETIKKDLPKGFQSSEFLLEHGFLDYIVERKDMRENLSRLLTLLKN